ncbi:flagellar assembly protein FliW [Paenibacillus odorifer]|uniref:flagellar assembly protein FliW n=1 Tax=Paenibacillus odorifer TaxID=189426 RepID=UPI003F6600C4
MNNLIIETLSWGKLEVDEEQIYYFSKGIPGFEDEKSFALIAMSEAPFWYLQSIKDQGVSFLLGDPFVFHPSYEFELPDNEAEELEIDSEIVVRCIISIKENTAQSTINLLAPIVLNPVKQAGKQIVLHKSPYHTKHSLFHESSDTDGKDCG